MMSGSAPANPGVDEADDVDYVISKCKRGLRGSTISLQLRGVLNAGVLLRGLYVFPLIDNLEGEG